ncbi:MAG: glycyl-tRNA ligase subunit beta [Pseudomonadota bacterium]|jgi:glycyl-tRNA synthetase beta chain
MPDLLLELFSEEIPARMQAQAAKDLERLTVGMLTDRGFLFEGIKAFGGPRRLTLAITGLPAEQKDVREELKGPKVDAPQAALDGFLKKTGLTKDQLKVEKTPKGDVYMAVIERKGRVTPLVLAEIIPEVMAKFPWPKSMRWLPGNPVRWVRPLHSILATFDGEVVPFEFAGIKSGNATRGHRFLSSGVIEVRRFEDYEAALKKAHVVLDASERAEIISHEIKQKAFALGLEPIEDIGLLAEVSGLAEWPTVLIGTIQDQFMDVPAEILQTSMRTHQKYFSLRDPKTGKMANRFALVANMVTKDGGKEIVAGNERVLRARLSDAKFFWDEDRKHSLDSRVEKLKGIVFHAKLGTQFERLERVENLAGDIAAKVGADVAKAKRAARLAKADLTTGVVGEFPELQGVMGRYYAQHDKEDGEVANAVRDHYRPVGPSDAVASNKVAIAVALADKLDAVAGMFIAGERPTGSGDPQGVRRAALGAIRTNLESGVRFNLRTTFFDSVNRLITDRYYRAKSEGMSAITALEQFSIPQDFIHELETKFGGSVKAVSLDNGLAALPDWRWVIDSKVDEIMSFFADRLKVALKEKGIRHDLIDAVFSLGREDDLVRLVARVEALQVFLKDEDGANLLAAYRRTVNILRIEEKKDGTRYEGEVEPLLLREAEEKGLWVSLVQIREDVSRSINQEEFIKAMAELSGLRQPVDAFFEKVKVNADEVGVRKNRLNLLASLRATLHQVADFSKIEG